MTSRTVVLTGILLVVAAAGARVDAQQTPRVAKIGFLSTTTRVAIGPLFDAFRQGLRERGYVEGKTVVIELRVAEGRVERIPELARELVALKMDVIVATIDPAIAAAKRETRTIPIVMTNSSDPAGTGFVTSLAHPGGNLTGLSSLSPELNGKRLELLKEAIPGLSRVALVWNPDSRGNLVDYKEAEGAARSQRLELQSVELSRVEDFDRAFAAVTSERAQALLFAASNGVAFFNRDRIASFALTNRLPSIYAQREYVDAGGLMSYGPSTTEQYRRAAVYVDKILKGAKPADLPVEQPTRFELVVNLKTARGLGMTIPQSILRRADDVIQ